MPKLANLARMTTATSGAGTITLGSAVSGFLSFSAAGIVDGDIVRYGISDGANSEVGYGTYTASGTTLTRNPITSTNSNAAISLSGNAQVFITATKEDFVAEAIAPGGRLTLTSNTPVMTANATAQTTVYYTPYRGAYVPIWDGSSFVPVLFSQLSQLTTDTTKSPAAAASDSCYDVFVWNDAGTLRATRGPPWVNSRTFTITIGTGTVNTTGAHGLTEQMAVKLSTTGALPTGLVAGTTYYVGRQPVSTSFIICSSVSNAINNVGIVTSGTQSGTHTVTNATTQRGTGAGTSELQYTQGILTNKNAITNGPAAGFGTYVGTFRTNASAQVDWNFGGAGTGGAAATFNLWNAYNRINVVGSTQDNGTSYNYSSSAFRIARASLNNQVNFVTGLQEELCECSYCTFGAPAAATNAVYVCGMTLDDASVTKGAVNAAVGQTSFAPQLSLTCVVDYFPGLGSHWVAAVERSDGTNNSGLCASGGTNILTFNYPM